MSEETKKTHGTISRRDFLRNAGIVVGGTAVGSSIFFTGCNGDTTEITSTVTNTVTKTDTKTITKYQCPFDNQEFDSLSALKAHLESVHDGGGTIVDSVGNDVIGITINNEEYVVGIQPEWSLQYLLHDILGFASIKDMCTGYGACGTCTAVVDGRPALTCMMLASECDGVVIETAEGLARDNHPLIDACVKYDCMQCGFCTPGFVTTAKALIDRIPNPTEDDIREALAGNLCRCGTYPQYIPAILEAASKTGGSK